jgi:hypothetical protein
MARRWKTKRPPLLDGPKQLASEAMHRGMHETRAVAASFVRAHEQKGETGLSAGGRDARAGPSGSG